MIKVKFPKVCTDNQIYPAFCKVLLCRILYVVEEMFIID